MRALALVLGFVAIGLQFMLGMQAGPLEIIWTDETRNYTGDIPGFRVQRRLLYSADTQTILTHSQLARDSSIYSSDMFSCDTSAKRCAHIIGNGSDSNDGAKNFPASTAGGFQDGTACTPDCPGDRHPDFMTTIDTRRHQYAQYSGLIFGNPETGGARGHLWNDFWVFSENVWTKVAGVNADLGGASGVYNAVMVYWPPDDIYWMFGGPNDDTYVMCRSASISGNQSAAGCVRQNQWVIAQPTAPSPMNVRFTLKNAIYDPVLGKILVFWWDNVSGEPSTMRVFAYTMLKRAWSELSISGDVPSNAGASHSEWLMSRISVGPHAGLFHFHRTGHTTSQTPAQAADFLFNSATGVWSRITARGTGPSAITFLDHDATVGTHGTVVAHEIAGGVALKIWHGTFQTR
jgi:hypothetical protein